jgi:hypothetical protein
MTPTDLSPATHFDKFSAPYDFNQSSQTNSQSLLFETASPNRGYAPLSPSHASWYPEQAPFRNNVITLPSFEPFNERPTPSPTIHQGFPHRMDSAYPLNSWTPQHLPISSDWLRSGERPTEEVSPGIIIADNALPHSFQTSQPHPLRAHEVRILPIHNLLILIKFQFAAD